MMLKRKSIFHALLFLWIYAALSPVMIAQESQKRLTNADVIKMVKAGVPESVIISSMQSGPVNFDLSPLGLAALGGAGVSKNIQNAMKARMSAQQGSPTSGTPGTGGGAKADELNPQPLPPRGRGSAPGSTNSVAGTPDTSPPAKQTAPNDPRRQGHGQPDPKRVEHLKMAMKGRLSPVITNRGVPQTEAAIRALLQQQKQVALVSIGHTSSQDPAGGQPIPPGGPGNPPGSSRSSPTGAGSGNQPTGANPTGGSTPGARARPSTSPGGSSNPSGRSIPAGGSNNPPSIAGPSNGTPLSAKAAMATAPLEVCIINSTQAMILSVSGQPGSGAVLTQDPQFNPYTISGCNFGSGQGQAHLSDAAGRKLADLIIDSWTDTMLKVEVDPRLAGKNDLDNVTLVINPVSGQQAQKPGFKFHAMRKKVLLTALPPTGSSMITQAGLVTHGAAVLRLSMPQELDGYTVGAQFSSPYRGIDYSMATERQTAFGQVASDLGGNDGQGMTAGIDRDSSGHGYPGGADTWQIKGLAPGFYVDSFQMTNWNVSYCTTGWPIADTQTHNYGNWNASLGGDTITVQFMSEYCEGNNGGHNGTNASYALNIWVTGPAGIDPITGQPAQ